MQVEVNYSDSFYQKLNPDNYRNCIIGTVKDIAEEALNGCQSECPVRTGNLRDSHDVEVNEFEASVTNSADYWEYVVYGTRRTPPNNYPERVRNNLVSGNVINDSFRNELLNQGIDVE